MLDECVQHGDQAHLHGLALINGHHVYAVCHLQITVFIQLLQHLVGIVILFNFHHGAQTRAVGLVADIVDAAENRLFFIRQLKNLGQHIGLVDPIGHLGDANQRAPQRAFFNVYPRAQGQLAAAGLIGRADFRRIQQHAAGGKIRRGQYLHKVVQRGLGLVDAQVHRADNLLEVMRRDVGGQAHRDARRAVDQQVGEPRGQDLRLLEGIVKVQMEGHSVLIQIAQHLQRQRSHARLGITHGGGAVAVDGAKVAMAVHQRGAQ